MVSDYGKRGASNLAVEFGHSKDKREQLFIGRPIPRLGIVTGLAGIGHGMAACIIPFLLKHSRHVGAAEVSKEHKVLVGDSEGEHRRCD